MVVPKHTASKIYKLQMSIERVDCFCSYIMLYICIRCMARLLVPPCLSPAGGLGASAHVNAGQARHTGPSRQACSEGMHSSMQDCTRNPVDQFYLLLLSCVEKLLLTLKLRSATPYAQAEPASTCVNLACSETCSATWLGCCSVKSHLRRPSGATGQRGIAGCFIA